MSSYKLIFCDLDGTLLMPDLVSLSEENKRALAELARRGVYVVPCSGRTYNLIPKVLTECPHIKYVASSNGTCIYDRESGEIVVDNRPTAEERELMLDLLGDYDVFSCFHTDGDALCERSLCTPEGYARYGVDEYFGRFFENHATKVDRLAERTRDESGYEMACVFSADAERLAEMQKRMDDTGIFRTAKSHINNVEIFPLRSGKGNAVRALAEKLGIDISETIAVGDSNNDVTMVSAAGLGLAVENAIPELKSVADEVVCHFMDHVLEYILNHYICK